MSAREKSDQSPNSISSHESAAPNRHSPRGASGDGQDGGHWRLSQAAPACKERANSASLRRTAGCQPERKPAGANRNEQSRGGTHEAHQKVSKFGARRE